MNVGLRAALKGRSLEEFLARWQPEEVSATVLAGFENPSPEFVDFVCGSQPTPFDDPQKREFNLVPTSFHVAQMHKTWLILNEVRKFLSPKSVVLDAGSYPFSVPLALRSFLGFDGRLVASVVQPLGKAGSDILNSLKIETCSVDLDPKVVDASISKIPHKFPLEDASVDIAILSHVIEHLYHPMDILNELRRVIKPGGRLIIFTDNAFRYEVLINIISGADCLTEPVQGTAAMQINQWRGHVRFFSGPDIVTMGKKAGFLSAEVGFKQIFYNKFSKRHFVDPIPRLSGWQIDLLQEYPNFRNDVMATLH